MPYLKIQTNQNPDEATAGELLRSVSETVAEILGKPESYVMVAMEKNIPMLFAGTSKPLAYLELKSIGLPEDRTAGLSASLATLIGGALGVETGRIYIEFADAKRHMWGWKGGTF